MQYDSMTSLNLQGFYRTLDSSSAEMQHVFNGNAQVGNFPILTVKLFRLTKFLFFIPKTGKHLNLKPCLSFFHIWKKQTRITFLKRRMSYPTCIIFINRQPLDVSQMTCSILSFLNVFCDRTVIWVDSPLQSKLFTYSKILEKSTKIWPSS